MFRIDFTQGHGHGCGGGPAPSNAPPTANDDCAWTDEDNAVWVAVLGNDTDPDGDPLTVISAAAGHGTVTIGADGRLHYQPDPDYNGADKITYTISDGHGGTDTAEVHMSVYPVNDAPVAVDDVANVPAGMASVLDVLANDYDVDGDSLAILGTPVAQHGSVSVNADGTLTYTPAAGYTGPDTITYEISDGQGGTASAIVDLTVGAGGSGPDGIVEGTSGDDVIDYGYTGDPDGDMVDHGDAILPGQGPQDDIIYGYDGDDLIRAGEGNDTVYGGDGDDTIYGGDGDDVIDGGAGDDTIYGGAGNDHIIGGDGDDFIDGGDGDDKLEGGAGDDTIYGGAGNDEIYGNEGDDTIYGGSGDDVIYGGPGNNTIYGGSGDDVIWTGEGDSFAYGGSGADHIYSGPGANHLYGGDDEDTFHTVGPGDFVDGGEGFSPGHQDYDVLDLSDAGPVRINYDADNPENGTVDFLDDHGNIWGSMEFKNIEHVIPCFTPGTMIATPKGERPVESLAVGDKVITRDNGIQEIRWIGSRTLDWRALQAQPNLRPILIRKGSIGHGLPERDMLVSPNHRVLVANDQTQLYFEEREVLVAAKHLVNNTGVSVADALGATYLHFMCDHHEVVLSDGAWTESFQPGDYTLKGIGNAQRAEIFALFPELKTAGGIEAYASARRTLKKHEAQMLWK